MDEELDDYGDPLPTCKGICAYPDKDVGIRACGMKHRQPDGTFLCYDPSDRELGYPGCELYKHCGSFKPLQMELELR